MKKTLSLLILYSIFLTQILGQGVTQSAEGTSTVILEGSAISIDLAKTDLSFGWNNLNNKIITKNNSWLIGTNVKVKNAEGIGSLFSKGDLVPQGAGTFFLGGYFSNAIEGTSNDSYLVQRTILLTEAIKLFKDTLDAELNEIAHRFIPDTNKQKTAIKLVTDFYDRLPNDQKLFFPSRFDATDSDIEIRMFKIAVKTRFTTVKKNAELGYRNLSKERFIQTGKTAKAKDSKYFKFTYFAFGGIDATDFKRYIGIDSSNLTNSFKDEYFRGGHLGVGVNFEYWRFRFGVTYSYVASHNFSALTSGEYTLQSTTTINNQSLQAKEVITAYKGKKYGKVEKNDLNFDIIYNCKLDKDGKNHLLINPYLRGSIFSRDTSLLINRTNIGLGGYFFKEDGKFLGGIYLELPDINNNAEKKKPVDQQNLRAPLRRLSFGIVTKFSLKALFGW